MSLRAAFAARIATENAFSLDESFEWIKRCSAAIDSKSDDTDAREVIVRVLEARRLFPNETLELWFSLVEAAGLYQYILEEKHDTFSALWREFHKSNHLDNTYFHSEQNEISIYLASGESVVLSAPTSFGKSLLIEEIVASRRHRNIVIIQPTLALLDETRKKLGKYRNDYKIIVSTSELPSSGGNIFLFTGERVVEYRFWTSIDFFVIDEFYKLSLDRDDDRAVSLNQALHKLLKLTKKFYLLGPSVDSVPDEFREHVAFKWHWSKFATVALDEIKLGDESKLSADERKDILFSLLGDLDDSTLVYCSSPERSVDLVKSMLASGYEGNPFRDSNADAEVKRIIHWIENNIHADWILCEALKKGIAFHHGGLPRHIGSSFVDLFNLGAIKTLFCTSTLIEGVNTSAKNVILFDQFKGRKPIDFFDFRNIAGRSGRMFKYFTGRLYRFLEPPEQYELNVDIPLFTQLSAPLELLIQLETHEIKPEVHHKFEILNGIEPDLFEIIKNNGINVEGQLEIVNKIQESFDRYKDLLTWKKYPKYPQLLAVIELGWNNLLRKNESKGGIMSARQLAYITIGYMITESLGAIIHRDIGGAYWIEREPDPIERVNKVVSLILNAARHWFDYKLPKWLAVISSLQAYVFKKNGLEGGDYKYLATQLENGFLPPNLAILMEYDVPISALQKLKYKTNANWSVDEIFEFLRSNILTSSSLDEYEKLKIQQAVF